jgi:hypothetical protein
MFDFPLYIFVTFFREKGKMLLRIPSDTCHWVIWDSTDNIAIPLKTAPLSAPLTVQAPTLEPLNSIISGLALCQYRSLIQYYCIVTSETQKIAKLRDRR